MRKRYHQKTDEELNFWQPASDMFSALLLILMLIILLLGLYLVQIPEYNQKDPWAGNTYAEGNKEDPESAQTPQPTVFFWLPGGGNDGETPHPTYIDAGTTPSASPSPTVSPTPDLPGGGAAGGGGGLGGGEGAGEGPGQDPDMGMKSAVYVMLVDAETERTVKEANVEFELYGENHSLQTLNVYYPERLSFRFYDTTEDGTFYLPEKMTLGSYELKEITEPAGYDPAGEVAFELDETRDWSDPFVVTVPVYPSKNVIRVQMNDAETGRGIEGGSFVIIADESIITADGTLRYRAGQQVGEILCDENGAGVSEELYLGSYRLVQRDIPPYYVGLDSDLQVHVEKQSRGLPPVNVVASQRTKIHLSLLDETNPARGLSGAVFTVTGNRLGLREEMTTNNQGAFTLNQLEKGVTYQITQTGASGDFQLSRQNFSVTVDSQGRIDGEPEKSLEVYNHMIRVSIGITDEFSSVQVPNVNLTLYDGAANTLVRSWTSTGAPLTVTNLKEGPYYLYIEDDTNRRYDFYVYDRAELQEVNLNTTYILHYLIYGGIILLALILVIAAVIVILRIRKKRRQAREEE